MKFIEAIINSIFPPVCGICGEISEGYICEKCNIKIQGLYKNKVVKHQYKFFYKHFSMFDYKDEIRNLIVNYKFNDKSYLHGTITEIIKNNEKAVKFLQDCDYIVPVPIHKKRYKNRGYNQCSLILKELCKTLKNVKYRDDVLIKIKNIQPQSKLNKEERKDNIAGAFEVRNTDGLEGKKVILFDDVYTTGSTADECARMLKEKIKCKNVNVFTIAKD